MTVEAQHPAILGHGTQNVLWNAVRHLCSIFSVTAALAFKRPDTPAVVSSAPQSAPSTVRVVSSATVLWKEGVVKSDCVSVPASQVWIRPFSLSPSPATALRSQHSSCGIILSSTYYCSQRVQQFSGVTDSPSFRPGHTDATMMQLFGGVDEVGEVRAGRHCQDGH